MNKQKTVSNSGFTLIELMVVIAIIGLLSAIVLAALSSARQKAKNATYVEELHQVQIAMEEYYQDNGQYPGGSTCVGNGCCIGTSCMMAGSSITPQITLNISHDDLNYKQLAVATLSSYLPNLPTTDQILISGTVNKGFVFVCSSTNIAGNCTDGDIGYPVIGTPKTCPGGSSHSWGTDNVGTYCHNNIKDLQTTSASISSFYSFGY